MSVRVCGCVWVWCLEVTVGVSVHGDGCVG